MSEKLYRWFAAEIGPRLPIVRITGGNIWAEPGERLCRAEVMLLGFVLTLPLAGCAPEPERVVCWERATNKAVAAHVMMSRFETIYVYLDGNDLEQRITPKNSHLWRCVRQGDG